MNRILRVLDQTTGPAPWYADNFPSLKGLRDTLFTWKLEPEKSLVSLHAAGELNETRMLVGMGTRVFSLPPGRLGVWYPLGTQVHLLGFDPEQLPSFILEGKNPIRRAFLALGHSLFHIIIEAGLERGYYPLYLPAQLAELTELLFLADLHPLLPEDASQAIVQILPKENCYQVLPQNWLTANRGYHLLRNSIARVARDPLSGRLVGDGILLQPFHLTEDGCDIDKQMMDEMGT